MSGRREFIIGGGALLAAAGMGRFAFGGVAAGDAKLRVGVLSDIHINSRDGAVEGCAGADMLEKALRYFGGRKVDAVLIAGAKEAGEPVVVGGHVAPFMANAREPDTYENHPRTGRVERLKMYLDGGTRFYLSGHTHRLVVRSYRGMPILNPETTCRNSDGMPFGFRMLTVHPDGNWGWDFRRA